MRPRTNDVRRRPRRLITLGWLVALVALAALVAGCSSDDDGGDAKSTKSTKSTTTQPAATTTAAGGTTDPNATPSTPPTAPAGPKAAEIKNPSEVSTSTIPKADQVPFPRSACQALTDDEVAAAPWASIKNAKVLRSGVDDAGAACGWQIEGDGGARYTLRVAFETRDRFNGDVAQATNLQKVAIGDEAYLIAAPPNVTPETNSVWVRVGDKVAVVDAESVASAEQLAAAVAARL